MFCADIRQRGRIAGFSLLVSKTGDIHGATLCYKAGPQLPPLNFTSICSESGRYVIFYNERLDGVTYPEGYEVINVLTELCEVTVQGKKKIKLRNNIFQRKHNMSFIYFIFGKNYFNINKQYVQNVHVSLF